MPRKPRKNLEQVNFYHVMVQGINKEYIFNEEKLINKYLMLLMENSERFNIQIITYCIMNNHVHLLIQSNSVVDMSKMMQKINMSYARYYNFIKTRVGYVFRDRYLSQPILTEQQLMRCIDYIHNNPVKAGMVEKAEQYKFSNCKEFYTEKNIEKLKKIIQIDFMQIKQKESYVEGEFIEQDIDVKERISSYIIIFCKQEGIKIIKIFENREILKKLIKYLKNNCKIKYTDIMKVMEITPGAMGNLKR